MHIKLFAEKKFTIRDCTGSHQQIVGRVVFW